MQYTVKNTNPINSSTVDTANERSAVPVWASNSNPELMNEIFGSILAKIPAPISNNERERRGTSRLVFGLQRCEAKEYRNAQHGKQERWSVRNSNAEGNKQVGYCDQKRECCDTKANSFSLPSDRRKGDHSLWLHSCKLRSGECRSSPGRDERLSIVKTPDFATRVDCVVRRNTWSQPKFEPCVSMLETQSPVKLHCVVAFKVSGQLY